METDEWESTTASTLEIVRPKDCKRATTCLKRSRVILLICILLIVAGVVAVLVIFIPRSLSHSQSSSSASADLKTLILKVQKAFYEFYPNEIIYKPGVTDDEVRAKFRPFGLHWKTLKNMTDTAATLRSELNSFFKSENVAALTQRNLRALYEARRVLLHLGRGTPYESNYYAGDWMLGPNIMLWQPIGTLQVFLEYSAPKLKPRNLNEVDHFIDILKQHKNSFVQFMENMKMGVKRGMVRNIEACKAGLLSFKHANSAIATTNETGILSSKLANSRFLDQITKEMREDWDRRHNLDVTSSLREALVEYLGKPINNLISYMENEHMRHCVPDNVSSGLANLPLTHVYVDGVPDLSRPTVPLLPSGEPLNGSFAFKTLMSFFTTTDITPEEVNELGHKRLADLYEQAVSLAKQVTNEVNSTLAVEKFRRRLTSRSLFFNAEPFPDNESIENSFLKCRDMESAKAFCPKRWEAYNLWKNSTKSIQQSLLRKIEPLFYTSGKEKTTPSCSAVFSDVAPNFSPTCSYHSYHSIRCGLHLLPFFIDNYGPTYSEWTTTAHEMQPGHNLEVNGYYYNFRDKTGDVITWLSDTSFFSGFSEGWATYAEYPLVGADTNAYKEDLMSKYGMLQQEIIAALRLVIETGLHYFGMSRSAALKLFDEHAWDNSDIAEKEITRYQSVYGHAVSYMVGQTAFIKIRKFAEKELGPKFTLPEFHYQVLHQGEVTLDYLEKYIHQYVACVKGGDTGAECNKELA